jgi:ATP-dependent helicase HrpB
MAERLPIYDLEPEILDRLRAQRRLILSAPTGSGKSTQVPQILLQRGLLGPGQVVTLQPRRLAARLLARRVAEELGVPLGREVGYQIRFENVTSPATRIRFVTEGVLLRQMIDDSRLEGVSALLFDEFHERHLYGDITLARALDLQERERPDLLIFVMSATLEAGLLETYLRPCAVLTSEGRTHPVEIEYAATPRYVDPRPVWEQAAEAFGGYVRSGGRGDVLVFMPGGYEIAQTIEAIRQCDASKGYLLLPLHGELPPTEQDAAVARYRQPKVVVATNVAETSLTIDGVRLVIDSGLARIPRYDPYRGINTLLIEKISQASADQRAGRAGRTAPGVCHRLWSEREHQDRAAQELPEVKRLDLAEVVLTLKAAGVSDLRRFRWLEPPDEPALAHAEELLTDLGALDHAGRITGLGRRMLAFPVHPRYARMLLAAQEYGCVYQACLVAALTQGRDLLLRKVDKQVAGFREDLLGGQASSDFWILMRAWTYAAKSDFRLEACRKLGVHAVTARQVRPLLDQFLRIAKDEGLDTQPRPVNDDALQRCILIGFSDRVARRLDSGTLRCELVHGRRGVLARESVVQRSPLFVTAEVREVGQTGGETQTLLSLATAIERDWLRALFPDDLTRQTRVFFDATIRRVQAEEAVRFRDLALETRRVEPPPADEAARLLAEEVMAGRLKLGEWDHGVEQWILRLNRLSGWCPELELPPITDEDRRHLIEQICHGAFSYKDIKDKPVKAVVMSWLNPAQRDLLDQHAPERLALSNGRTPKVTYEAGGAPFIALRIQELFGVEQTPKIGRGRVPVVVHILAPSMRPVQITQDLAGFWREHYPRIKQQLQRKYPKHEWR